jgi:hypothetical protein
MLAPGCRPDGLRGPAADGLAVLGVVHDLGALGRLAPAGSAQLAHQVAAGEDVDALADQGAATAVPARGATGDQGDDPLAQERAFEVGLGDPQQRSEHGEQVRRRPPGSCRQPLVDGD